MADLALFPDPRTPKHLTRGPMVKAFNASVKAAAANLRPEDTILVQMGRAIALQLDNMPIGDRGYGQTMDKLASIIDRLELSPRARRLGDRQPGDAAEGSPLDDLASIRGARRAAQMDARQRA